CVERAVSTACTVVLPATARGSERHLSGSADSGASERGAVAILPYPKTGGAAADHEKERMAVRDLAGPEHAGSFEIGERLAVFLVGHAVAEIVLDDLGGEMGHGNSYALHTRLHTLTVPSWPVQAYPVTIVNVKLA